MIVKSPPPFGCPVCNNALHYSSCFDQSLCTECGWVPGNPYAYRGDGIQLQEYLMLASILIIQYNSRQIDYETYRSSLMDEVYIK